MPFIELICLSISNNRWLSDIEDTFIIFKDKNNETFVTYFVELGSYIIPNVWE